MSKKFTSLVLVSIVLMLSMLKAAAFSDTGKHWAEPYIEQLVSIGAINGYTDGTFRPDEDITRAEFTAILLRATGSSTGQPEDGKWYERYKAEAEENGYILEGELENFEGGITRGEMARMIVRAMNETYPDGMADYAAMMRDYDSTPAEYKDFVLKAYMKGIITGRPDGKFYYNDTATRAEASTMIVRLIDKSRRIVPELEKPRNNTLVMYEFDSKKEVPVTTSHPELIPHIRKGMEILSTGGYLTAVYDKKGFCVQFIYYKDQQEAEKDPWERKAILSYDVFTEQDSDLNYYLPYKIHLYDTKNTTGQQKFLAIVKDVFPGAYDIIAKELDNKVKDTNYENKIWKKVNGREIRVFTFKGSNQINVYIKLEE